MGRKSKSSDVKKTNAGLERMPFSNTLVLLIYKNMEKFVVVFFFKKIMEKLESRMTWDKKQLPAQALPCGDARAGMDHCENSPLSTVPSGLATALELREQWHERAF